MMVESEVSEEKTSPTTQIFGTSITVKYVEEVVTNNLETSSKFGKNMQLTRIGIGDGYLSVIARLEPDWTPSGPTLPQSLIIKIPNVATAKHVFNQKSVRDGFHEEEVNVEDIIATMQSLLHQAHNAEVRFYEFAAKHNIDVKIPKMYFAKSFSDSCDQGLLILEDKGRKSIGNTVYRMLTVDEVKQVISSVAAVHAYSLDHPECLNLGDITINSFTKKFNDPKMIKSRLGLWEKLDEVRMKPICCELQNYVEKLYDVGFLETLHEEFGLPPMLVHGDLWSSNMIWTQQGEKQNLEAIIDWQIIHKGCGVEDIIRLISSSLSPRDRRSHQEDILQFYYSQLEEHCGRKMNFSFQQLKAALIRAYPSSMSIFLSQLVGLSCMHLEFCKTEDRETFQRNIKEKGVGLAEDILYYFKLSSA